MAQPVTPDLLLSKAFPYASLDFPFLYQFQFGY